MSRTYSLILALVTGLLGAAAGAYAGYYAAIHVPVEPSVVVYDSARLGQDLLTINLDDPVAKAKLDNQLKAAKAEIQAMVDRGIIVVSADAVIQAPDSAYIQVAGGSDAK
jgi:hypothetical protein